MEKVKDDLIRERLEMEVPGKKVFHFGFHFAFSFGYVKRHLKTEHIPQINFHLLEKLFKVQITLRKKANLGTSAKLKPDHLVFFLCLVLPHSPPSF